VLDRLVRFQQISFEAFKSDFIERGASEAFAQGMTDMMRAKNDGLDNAEPRTAENTTVGQFPAVVRRGAETRTPRLTRPVLRFSDGLDPAARASSSILRPSRNIAGRLASIRSHP